MAFLKKMGDDDELYTNDTPPDVSMEAVLMSCLKFMIIWLVNHD